ncbi:tigger transposable element-derived protein 6-like [Hermetia illucens]|uniref:tigger transposable element-derived protein 6-like n=1 Tax=Hermetia illucens TaxID=343691 RepID=UPI0018CC2CA5|nr:tigger transposable element-derived protein 6-like [Hermetia illucens]
MSPNRHVTLSLKQKMQIIKEIKCKEKTKQEVCVKYKCSMSTINRIIQNEKNILENSKMHNLSSKRIRNGACYDVDRAVSIWFDQMRASGAIISANMILEKSKQFAVTLNKDFNPTTGWLWRWQKREGISLKKIHGEAASADSESANNFINTLFPNLIEGYKSSDIFNADESGLFFKALPVSTLSRKESHNNGFKSSKDRLTLLFICNATGDYKKVIIIGKPKNPRCFKNKIVPLKYYPHQKAWMTREIWESILISLDEEMAKQNRKIILFVDNAASHKTRKILKNINIQYLPANTTSLIQPLDQGIIHSFKAYYRQIIIRKQISAIESGKTIGEFAKSINIFNALHIIKHVWWLVRPLSITRCFQKAKFISECDAAPSAENEQDDITETISDLSGDEFDNYNTSVVTTIWCAVDNLQMKR